MIVLLHMAFADPEMLIQRIHLSDGSILTGELLF